MEYYAHIDEKNRERRQTVKAHLEETANLAGQFADRFGCGDWGYCCGLLHDVGKYSKAFQERILGKNDRMVDHSTAGAQLCFEQGGRYSCLSFCIAGHHAGLPDYGSTGGGATLCGRLQKKIENYQAYQTDIEVPKILSTPFNPEQVPDPGFSFSVLIRMLFSCLVDADYLDTEMFMKEGNTGRESGESIETLYSKLYAFISDWLLNSETETINGRRTEILRNCLKQGIRPRGLFRLTVPPGGGKTIASLAFALRHAMENHMERVIYVIPYTSIIEQNAAVFREILGDKNVLENHYNVDYKENEELNPMYLAAENWDRPVVVTTNVQFFESLFSNKPSKCRKLHNIANSVIVFDEAQMLPNDYLKPCVAIMEELLCNYRSSLVLCTATQPSLQLFFQFYKDGVELCPRLQEQFHFFKRVTFRNIGKISEERLAESLRKEKQALCIVNTRRKAQLLYEQLKADGVFHLSTSMYPLHRQRVLRIIRERLSRNERCIVVSTSLVEAGVDLDFCSVYRQLAGVDSMIQAAGRCNREGKHSAEESSVFIFQFEEQERIPGQEQQISTARTMINEEMDISALESIENYFTRLYHVKGDGLDKKHILDHFQKRPYFDFAEVGKKFRFIEENTKAIFISKEDEAKEILQCLHYRGVTRKMMRRAGRYCVQIYEKESCQLYDAGMIRQVCPEIEDFYELVDEERYTENMGLILGGASGLAIFG